VCERLFAYISPDYDKFRSLLMEKISSIIGRFGIDAVHLDQSAAYIDDPKHDVSGGFRWTNTNIPHLVMGRKITQVFKELFNSYSKPVGHMGYAFIGVPKALPEMAGTL